MQKKRALLIGIFSGTVVLLFGFTIMYLMWRMIGSPQGLPGFFFYRAATIGDGICLPILVGATVTFNQHNSAFLSQSRKISLLMALLASLVAILMQASWLIRDDTVLNWSIPIQHHFNIAGWYHSLFFISIFGVVAYQLCGMWFVIRERQAEYLWFEKIAYMLFVFSGTFFLFMHIADDYSQYLQMPVLLSITAVGIFITQMIYIKTTNGIIHDELLPATIMGVISAYSASLMICLPERGDAVIALGGGLCACFIWRVHNLSVVQMICKDVWTVIFYFGILYKLSASTNIVEMVCAFLFLTVATVICEDLSNGEARTRTASLIALEGYILLNIFPIEIQEIDMLTDFLFMITISFLFRKEIKSYFAEVVEAKEKLNTNRISSQNFMRIKGKAYLQIVIGIIAATILIFHWLIEIGGVVGNQLETGTLYIPRGLIGIMLLVIGLLIIGGTEWIRKYMAVKISSLLLSILLFGALITMVAVNIGKLSFLSESPFKMAMLGCSVCACIGAGILSAHGYYMNMVLLRGLNKKKFAAVMATIQLVGGTSLTFAMTTLILYQQTWKNMLLIGIAAVTAFIVIPLLHARVFRYEHKTFHVVGNSPLGGIVQDGLMICLIVFFVICMPCLYISLSTKGISAWLGVLGLACTAFPPVEYCLRNNVEHMKRQRKVLKKYPEEEDMWEILHKCLVRQSKQTLFATFPYVCIAAIAAYGSRMMKSMERGEIPGDIYNTYIDADDYESWAEKGTDDV